MPLPAMTPLENLLTAAVKTIKQSIAVDHLECLFSPLFFDYFSLTCSHLTEDMFVFQGGYAAYRYAQPTAATAAAYSDSQVGKLPLIPGGCFQWKDPKRPVPVENGYKLG
uniref:Uncharacterized protein n=1 Tax=Sphaerodactylus townsendi TaxID=933632 RepID=A0ACB8FKZ4_9SAUR